ncbi:MAG: DUF4142 domain-containing protein [Cyclobacteriaceae bacterium]
MKSFFKIFSLTCLVAIYSCNDPRQGREELAGEGNNEKFEEKNSRNDAQFVEEVVASNYAEIKMAEIANQRSRNSEVKQIAQMLQTDHSGSLNELKTLAQSKAISVPVEENDEARQKMENFSAESGKDFDVKWCKEMIDKHEDNIDRFEKRLENSDDADLKSWISRTLPTLRSHHDKLKACQEKLKEGKS